MLFMVMASLPAVVNQPQGRLAYEPAKLTAKIAHQSKATQPKSGNVWANGLSFAYVEGGSGTPVVLVHGSVSDYREWSAQMSPLARHYRVIAYSRRYHWPNSPPARDVDASLERQADDLGAILKSMGLAPAHIVGHSYGGAVALYLTLRHPELVRTLILAEPAISSILGTLPEDDPVSRDSQAVRTEMKNVFATGDPERIVSTYAARVAPGEFEQATPALRQMLLANVAAFQLDFNSRRPPITCEDAQRVAVPVLVLYGERSPLGLRSIAETAARCLKATKSIKIPQATHWMQHDHAEAFNAAVLAFLDRQGKQ